MAGVSSLLARLPGRAAGKPAAPAMVGVDKAKFKGTLIAKGLTKSYKGRKVVSGVTLGVRAGEAVGLLGPNGAGKTTCFYMVTGLVPVDEGTIEIDGFDVTSMPMYRRARLGIGYLPQEASIFRGLSVEQNIRAVLEVVEKSRKERERTLDELLEEFHISHLRKAPSLSLSGGERRRLEIARALATRPAYMLLDEPFAALGVEQTRRGLDMIRQVASQGIGVVIITHIMQQAFQVADRIVVIRQGVVAGDVA
ncbi:MAG: LPS export ABC transporter ATP-binding protein, partial [Mesorhizobium sp.]